MFPLGIHNRRWWRQRRHFFTPNFLNNLDFSHFPFSTFTLSCRLHDIHASKSELFIPFSSSTSPGGRSRRRRRRARVLFLLVPLFIYPGATYPRYKALTPVSHPYVVVLRSDDDYNDDEEIVFFSLLWSLRHSRAAHTLEMMMDLFIPLIMARSKRSWTKELTSQAA